MELFCKVILNFYFQFIYHGPRFVQLRQVGCSLPLSSLPLMVTLGRGGLAMQALIHMSRAHRTSAQSLDETLLIYYPVNPLASAAVSRRRSCNYWILDRWLDSPTEFAQTTKAITNVIR
jgi:hypothetical protein